MINLSVKQRQAVEHKNGAILVIASAGSGKTRVLTERIKRLLDLTKRKILAITFTNKAGEEMRERLGNDERIKSQVFIGTFHSFCQQVLELRYKLLGLNDMPHIFEDDSDRLELIEQAIKATPSYYIKYRKADEKTQKDFRYKTLEYISKVKRELLSNDQLLEKSNEDTVLLYNTYQEILSSQNAIDFDDLIMLTHRLFANNPSIAALYRRTYEYICVDEAQDLNNAQYQLLKAIANGQYKNVMMVGDPNQSIFGFNGSSAYFMTKFFVQDFSPISIKLSENYRSSRKVVEIAEKIIPGSNDIVNFVIPGIFESYEAKNEDDETDWVISKIKQLMKMKNHDDIEGEISYEKIAILARNRFVFSKMEKRLSEERIPYYYKVTPGSIKFETKLMNVFDLCLRVKINPDDRLHWNRIEEKLKIKCNNTIDELLININDNLTKSMIELVINLKEDGSNFRKIFSDYIDYVKNPELEIEDNERKLIIDEIEDLLKHWRNYAKKAEIKSLQQFKNAMALGQTHPNVQQKGITLSTVHTMKGQEYEIVFIIGLDDGTFPDYRAINKGGVELIQEKNNTYVAFTRSRRFLFISYPKSRKMPWGDEKIREISRFLRNL